MIAQTERKVLNNIQGDMNEVLMNLIADFADDHHISGLSALSCALIVLANAMRPVGGPAARPYMNTVVEAVFSKSPKEIDRLNGRAMGHMESMIRHFDLLTGQDKGRMQ